MPTALPDLESEAVTMPEEFMLTTELTTFENHKDTLLAESQGKYALIHGDQIQGTFADESDAIAIGYKLFGNVPFLVKKITSVESPINFASNTLGLMDADIQCAGN